MSRINRNSNIVDLVFPLIFILSRLWGRFLAIQQVPIRQRQQQKRMEPTVKPANAESLSKTLPCVGGELVDDFLSSMPARAHGDAAIRIARPIAIR